MRVMAHPSGWPIGAAKADMLCPNFGISATEGIDLVQVPSGEPLTFTTIPLRIPQARTPESLRES